MHSMPSLKNNNAFKSKKTSNSISRVIPTIHQKHKLPKWIIQFKIRLILKSQINLSRCQKTRLRYRLKTWKDFRRIKLGSHLILLKRRSMKISRKKRSIWELKRRPIRKMKQTWNRKLKTKKKKSKTKKLKIKLQMLNCQTHLSSKKFPSKNQKDTWLPYKSFSSTHLAYDIFI